MHWTNICEITCLRNNTVNRLTWWNRHFKDITHKAPLFHFSVFCFKPSLYRSDIFLVSRLKDRGSHLQTLNDEQMSCVLTSLFQH